MTYCRVIALLAVSLAVIVLGLASPASGQDKVLDKINKALPETAPAKPERPRKILIYSKTLGFRHSSIPVGVRAITLMGDKTGGLHGRPYRRRVVLRARKTQGF